MLIAYVNDALITCGGIITNFEHCRELRKRGYDAFISANGRNPQLEKEYPDVPVYPITKLSQLQDEDVLIANWWMQCDQLINYKGKKFQFVQGNDLKAYIGDELKAKCLKTRQDPRWKLIAVSQYAGEWTGREFQIVPNGISERFFIQHNLNRDIDALIEGNNEPNKNILYSINEAKKDGHKRIVWLGRETQPIAGVETITNPPQQEIPKIYQRAKHFYKHSLSEGFCLPILEAKASGCIIHTWDQGNNFPEDVDPKEYTWERAIDKLLQII
jgi:hypothetical protein